jgi:hypothetical protein
VLQDTGSLQHIAKFLQAVAAIDGAIAEPRIANLTADFLDTVASISDAGVLQVPALVLLFFEQFLALRFLF